MDDESETPAANEAARLLALRRLQLLDTDPETAFDDLVRAAAAACAVPVALVSLVDRSRQWFKARVGVTFDHTPREDSICSHAIVQTSEIFEVPDLLADPRFATSAMVVGEPHIRSYAGVPLVVDGYAIGSFCVMDTVPRRLDDAQRKVLTLLARSVVATIGFRKAINDFARTEQRRERAVREMEVFEAAITHARDGLLILGRSSGDRVAGAKVIFANAAYRDLTGCDTTRQAGTTLREFVADFETLHAIERACEAAEGGTFAPVAFDLARPDGSVLHAEVGVAAVPNRHIDVGFVVVLRDATDRRSAEESMLAMHAALAEHKTAKVSEERLRALLARTPAIAYSIDREMTLLTSVGGGLRSIGLEPDQAVGWPFSALFPPDSFARPLALHKRALRGESVTYESNYAGRKWTVFLEPFWSAERSVEGVSAILFDVTESAATEEALAHTEALAARAARAARTGTWTHDLVLDRITYSRETLRIFGFTDEHADRESLYERVVPQDRTRVRSQMREAYRSNVESTFEYQIEIDGIPAFVHESVEVTCDADGRPTRVDGIVVDITDRRRAELESFRLTITDDVTGLANRSALYAQIKRRTAEGERFAALLAVNIDRFRSTNDAFGRAFGDGVLRAVAARLQSSSTASLVARLENATFGLLLPSDADPDEAAARLQSAFRAPFDLDGQRLFLDISIGIAPVASDISPDAMLSDADLALQSAKRAGGGRTVRFDANLAALEGRRIALDRDLRSAIERDELFLAYQPIVDAGESIVAVEALLRWVHPIHGRIPPDEFIPLAEANGTIVPIGRWVMQRACAETATLRNVCGRPLRVAVNVSAKQFSDADLQAVIHQALALCDLEPSALEIEVTESTIARHPAHASRVLRDLRAAGVTVAIDDFGTGQSSLASLRRHPVDNLKIDRSFVATTPDDAEACAIVEVILALAKQLSLGVVAEGVETAEQAHYLRSRGVTRLQGYHYSRPISARSLAELLATSSKSRFRARPFPAPARVRG